MGYKIDDNQWGKHGEDDDRARSVIAEVFAHVRGHDEPDWRDQGSAVHAVNALNNAGAVIAWPNTNTSAEGGTNADRLHKKYHVERTDGRDMGPYFILEYSGDGHARKALAAYADSCQDNKPQLAADIRAAIAGY